ncbi:cell division protein FtsB [Shewanella sp. VB17]|uniref:cell division protein FtsB n=1 Tax=Shewanella sp. VB17 TaxID=2739432 RepID=UPI0015634D6A|nr:cell division protein FtsB [Shewanella sp. VB17]NRD74880.1 cell division protein FtsB [Shewanella sp. VB17]
MKRLLFALASLLGLLQHQLWVGANSLPESFQLKEQISLQQASNAKLIARNQVLREEIIDLSSGTEALEERARNELGMVKEGETFFRVVGDKRASEVSSH